MRLPLGILSGMGFIGAGAILRKGSLVHGLTTAATLWFVTVLGLCFGGGQLVLGLAVLALGVLVLGGLKRLESRWKQDRHATLSLTVDASGPTEDELTTRPPLRHPPRTPQLSRRERIKPLWSARQFLTDVEQA